MCDHSCTNTAVGVKNIHLIKRGQSYPTTNSQISYEMLYQQTVLLKE